MTVQLIHEEEAVRLKLVAPVDVQPTREEAPPAPPPPKPSIPSRELMASALGVLTAIAAVLSVRLVLLLSWAGAFTLAVLVVVHPTTPAIVAMVFYDLLGFVPVVVLSRLKG